MKIEISKPFAGDSDWYVYFPEERRWLQVQDVKPKMRRWLTNPKATGAAQFKFRVHARIVVGNPK